MGLVFLFRISRGLRDVTERHGALLISMK